MNSTKEISHDEFVNKMRKVFFYVSEALKESFPNYPIDRISYSVLHNDERKGIRLKPEVAIDNSEIHISLSLNFDKYNEKDFMRLNERVFPQIFRYVLLKGPKIFGEDYSKVRSNYRELLSDVVLFTQGLEKIPGTPKFRPRFSLSKPAFCSARTFFGKRTQQQWVVLNIVVEDFNDRIKKGEYKAGRDYIWNLMYGATKKIMPELPDKFEKRSAVRAFVEGKPEIEAKLKNIF